MQSPLLTWEVLVGLANAAAKHFALRAPQLVPLVARPGSRTYGYFEYDHCTTCRCQPIIKLRLRGSGRRPLSRAAIVAVLAHELAHLKHLRHGRQHASLTHEIAAWLRERGFATTPHMLVVAPKAAACRKRP